MKWVKYEMERKGYEGGVRRVKKEREDQGEGNGKWQRTRRCGLEEAKGDGEGKRKKNFKY